MARSFAMREFLLVMVIIMAFESCVQAAPSGQTSSDTVEWLKITGVPLLVLLVGSCLLGYIKSIRHWRTVATNEGSAVSETGQPLGDSSGFIGSAPDVEAGVELPNVDDHRHARAEEVDVVEVQMEIRSLPDPARRPPISLGDEFHQNGAHTRA